VSIDDAIRKAQQNEPGFAAAVAAQRSAAIGGYLAKAALLPSVAFHNQLLYTEPNGQRNQGAASGLRDTPIFIANNAVHEYTSQAAISETIGFKQFSDAQVAAANASRATAELEIARRGLVSTVVSLYYTLASSEARRQLLTEALRESQSFSEMTQKRETAREVARADVVKAQLQQLLRQRDLNDATAAADKARLELAVLLFPDPRTPFEIQLPKEPKPLPLRDDVRMAAVAHNPELASAMAKVRAANVGIRSAKAGYLPDLSLNFNYGIDAPQFAKRGPAPDNIRNLGYSMMGTIDLPVWDWLSTQKRIKQSIVQLDAAKITLTATQRRLIAVMEETYAEAETAGKQLKLLDAMAITASESLRLTNLRYLAGESTALEVVDAQNALLSAEAARSDGMVRYQTALAALDLLTGQL
jgi:outer membrane protein TolC